MNQHTFKVLEYDKLIKIVEAYAATERGKAATASLLPARDAEMVESLLRETAEMMHILESGEHVPLDGIPDAGQAVDKLRISGAVLAPIELLHTGITLSAGRRIRTFFQRFEGKDAIGRRSAPLLAQIAFRIEPLKPLEEAVFTAIDEKAEVKDSASPALRRIRKLIARTREEILGRMSRILQESGFQKIIQEPVVTIRDDRYVLPLKPNFRQSLKGVVHGQSGSRATLFVEPLDVLEQNNRLAELHMDERDEVENILRDLTSRLSLEAGKIEQTLEALTRIDSIYARAHFGIEYRAAVPVISSTRRIHLRGARHPLLVAKAKSALHAEAITPNDIDLEEDRRALIVSGPNAGGKTIILKTAGILCLMAQAGLPVTAADGSEVPCFSSVFADIGDEQSIEQDLSTFSSHVRRIAEILRQADDRSLVLLDELGSGTDPGEGGGLGAAVLENLIARGCFTIVTTHHNALKLFASETGGAVNAAMEFDPQTVTPTYRMIPGRPGRSYGLDMASRLGVPESVIEKARARLGEDDVKLEQLLKQVEEDSRRAASEREALERALRGARTARDEANQALQGAREDARAIRSKAQKEVREVVGELRQKLRELSRASRVDLSEIKKINAEVQASAKKLEAGVEDRPAPAIRIEDIRPGDTVRVAKLNKTGIVLSKHRDMLELEVNGKKLRVAALDVTQAEAERQKDRRPAGPGWGAEFLEEESASNRLNIIGLRVVEGLAELERFIDRATVSHLSGVTVIHGLGTGALKAAVTDFLKNHPLIASIRPGEPSEGGAGVTVAEFKK